MTLEGLLVGRHQADLPLLLRKQVVWNHGHREACGGLPVWVGGRRVLHCSTCTECLALIWEDVRVRTGVSWGS